MRSAVRNEWISFTFIFCHGTPQPKKKTVVSRHNNFVRYQSTCEVGTYNGRGSCWILLRNWTNEYSVVAHHWKRAGNDRCGFPTNREQVQYDLWRPALGLHWWMVPQFRTKNKQNDPPISIFIWLFLLNLGWFDDPTFSQPIFDHNDVAARHRLSYSNAR